MARIRAGRVAGRSASWSTFSFRRYTQLLARINESTSEPVQFAQLGRRCVEPRGHGRERVPVAHLQRERTGDARITSLTPEQMMDRAGREWMETLPLATTKILFKLVRNSLSLHIV